MRDITNEYISTCHLEENRDINCPVFSIDFMLKNAEPDEDERNKMLRKVCKKP